MKDPRLKDFVSLQKKSIPDTVRELIKKLRKDEREKNSKSFVPKI